jgi:hypothetical protein
MLLASRTTWPACLFLPPVTGGVWARWDGRRGKTPLVLALSHLTAEAANSWMSSREVNKELREPIGSRRVLARVRMTSTKLC